MPNERPHVSASPDPSNATSSQLPQNTASIDSNDVGRTVDQQEGPSSTQTILSGRAESKPPAIPGYEILDTLGRGGMGVVYLARHHGLNRLVALKMILAGSHAGSDSLIRFRTEAEAVARLKHPNIVQIYDLGESDGCPFFSLEYVDGGSFAKELNGTPQPPMKAAELVSKLANAVHAAHQSGVIHRDLKPGNILLTKDGQPKVADFGLAKQLEGSSHQTVSGSILGTPSYMAPEQAAGRVHDVGPQADIYSLGAILYEAITGRPPFRGATMLETLEQVRSQEPVNPTSLQPRTPRDLETICIKCLQKEPGKRYASAQALADDLQRFLRHEPIHARSIGLWERFDRWRKRNRLVAALIMTSVTILLCGLILTTSLAVVAKRRANRIEAMNAELIAATKESNARGDVALKTLEAVIQDIQTELVNQPGAQKLRGRLLNKAMAGMQQLDEKLRTQKRADRSTALALLSMAEVFRQVGNDAGPKGPAAANQLYERAIEIFERLQKESPNSVDIKSQLAEAYLLYGINLAHTDDTGWEVTPESTAKLRERPLMKRGLVVHRQAADLRRQVLATKPTDPEAKQELARALNEWAYQEVRAGDVDTTRQILEEARDILKQLLSADPDHVANRLQFGKCTERLGDLYYDMKQDYDRCAPYYAEALATLIKLAEEQPNDAAIQMACANSWSRTADLRRAKKDVPGSLAASQQELAITQKLERAYPDNVQIILECSTAYDHNYRDNFRLENYEAARDMIRAAFEMRLPIFDADADSHRNMSVLLRTTRRAGSIHDKLNQRKEAIHYYEEGLKRVTAYVERTQDRSLDQLIAEVQKEFEEVRKKASN